MLKQQLTPRALAAIKLCKSSMNQLSIKLLLILALNTILVAQAYAEIVMGVFPRRPASITFHNFKPLADYLSQQMGEEVRLVVPKDFPNFWQELTEGRYDLVHYNQYHYIKSHKLHGFDVIVANQEFGDATIRSAIYTHKSSAITEPSQLKGKTLMLGGGRAAMISYIVPVAMMKKAGLEPGKDFTIEVAKNPPNALIGLYYKNADAAGTGDRVANLPVVKELIDSSKIHPISLSEPFPHLPWAVSNKISDEKKIKLQQLLINLNQTDEGKKILKSAKVNQFNLMTDSDYDMVRETVREALNEEY